MEQHGDWRQARTASLACMAARELRSDKWERRCGGLGWGPARCAAQQRLNWLSFRRKRCHTEQPSQQKDTRFNKLLQNARAHLTGSTCGSSTPSTRAALLRTNDTTSSTSVAELRMSTCRMERHKAQEPRAAQKCAPCRAAALAASISLPHWHSSPRQAKPCTLPATSQLSATHQA